MAAEGTGYLYVDVEIDGGCLIDDDLFDDDAFMDDEFSDGDFIDEFPVNKTSKRATKSNFKTKGSNKPQKLKGRAKFTLKDLKDAATKAQIQEIENKTKVDSKTDNSADTEDQGGSSRQRSLSNNEFQNAPGHIRKLNDDHFDPINIQEIKRGTKTYTKESLIRYFKNLKGKWLPGSLNFVETFEMILRNYELLDKAMKRETIRAEDIVIGRDKCLYESISLLRCFAKEKLLNEVDETSDTNLVYNDTFRKVNEMIHHGFVMLNSNFRTNLVTEPAYDPESKDDKLDIHRYEAPNLEGLNEYQISQLRLLDLLDRSMYKRYGKMCYRKKYTDDQSAYYTYSWEPVCTVEEFVYSQVSNKRNMAVWRDMTTKTGTIRELVSYLEKCREVQFPELKKDRHVISFRNGVYVTNMASVAVNDRDGDVSPDNLRDHFYRYGTEPPLDQSFVATNYIDRDFEEYGHLKDEEWYTIPTPNLQKIMDYQFKDEPDYEQICRFMYIFMGYMLYNRNELENWQVAPYIKGIAGSGKSTIANYFLAKIFDKADVGILQDSSQQQFALASVCDKMILLATEISDRFELNQTDVQQVVSGEDMAMAKKHDPNTVDRTWNVPFWAGGNMFFGGFVDSAGQLGRRFPIFNFKVKVDDKDIDGRLPAKLYDELPAGIKKINMAYHWAVREFGTESIWKHLPPYFHANRAALSAQTNTLANFLLNYDDIQFGDELYVPVGEFRDRYKRYCADVLSKRAKALDVDFYQGPFAEASKRNKCSIDIVKKKVLYPPDDPDAQMFEHIIVGLDFKNDDEEDIGATVPEDKNPKDKLAVIDAMNSLEQSEKGPVSPMQSLSESGSASGSDEESSSNTEKRRRKSKKKKKKEAKKAAKKTRREKGG
jgi:hypothetical protein